VGSPGVIDLDRLLAPITGDNPCGESLRWDPLYDEIKSARREDDKDALGAEGPTQADWPLVASKASAALAERSKDLMLAGFLTDALVQLHGFAGLRDGVCVLNRLIDNFWDGVYPLPDGDDLEPRAAPIVWLTEVDRGARLPNRVREVPLASATSNGSVPSWSLWKARYISPKSDGESDSAYETRRAEAEERAKVFEQAVAATPLEYYVNLREDLADCLKELQHLSTSLDQRFGRVAPGTVALRQALEECGALVGRIFKEKGGRDGAELEGATSATDEPAAERGTASSSGPIRSREDALRRLAEVAAYFRQAEPHSPISYLVGRAAAWGRMSFEELVTELVKDSNARAQIGELLGFSKQDT
jgi:type VI secretion system protein ImpA